MAFAFNTDTTDYVSIAQRTLKLASNTLELPYTLITDSFYNYKNTRHDIDTNQFVQWRNAGRCLAYDASPYNETIVIDVDYLMFDSNILKVFECDWDYQLMRRANGLTQQFPETMGPNSLPYVWATVFAFRKTPRAKMFFDLVRRVQDNYTYYRELFNVKERNFRNDYAFAIADVILNGYTINTTGIPGPMQHVDQPIDSITAQGNTLIIRDANQAYVLPRMNLHVMSKAYLQSAQFEQFINNESA